MEHVHENELERDAAFFDALYAVSDEKAMPDMSQPSRFAVRYIFIFGVILPLITLAVELITHECAEMFFVPFPTVWHMILFGSIAFGNGMFLLTRCRYPARCTSKIVLLNGLALGVAIWYTAQFLSITPISIFLAIFGIIFPPFMLFGFCGLSPLLALIAGIIAHRNFQIVATNRLRRLSAVWGGIFLAIVLLFAVEVLGVFTEVNMQRAISEDPTTSVNALSLLRRFGSRDLMLRRCYQRPNTGTGLLSLFLDGNDTVTPDVARTIYYRVTGVPFNDLPAPVSLGRRHGMFFAREVDSEQGGNEVAGKVDGLSLKSSRIDGSVDADAALAYLEWTMVFKNTDSTAHEARMQIALPPGAVVSRLTLWVNGEEREAAFAARGHVREAYQQVAIVQQRDPVLVTTCGPDRIMLQCYPVPADGKEMKVRLGITAPLVLNAPENAALALPGIIEQNYAIAPELHHMLWLEATQPVLSHITGIRQEQMASGAYAVRGEVREADFQTGPNVLHCQRHLQVKTNWTADSVDPRHAVIRQTIAKVSTPSPSRLILVVDSSLSMQKALSGICRGMSSLPKHGEFSLLVAGDSVRELMPLQRITPKTVSQVTDQLRRLQCVGGMDNVPALDKALDLAAQTPGGVVLWIHGPQPLQLGDIDSLQQRWDRQSANPRLYAIDAVPGDNALLRALDREPDIYNVPRVGTLSSDLSHILAQWNGTPQLTVTRERVQRSTWQPQAGSKETSTHLSRLWAHDQAMRRYAMGSAEDTEMAIAMAHRYQIVTPVTGAVVLENKEQYHEAGLEPVNPGTVPTVPEPEFWVLVSVAAGMLTYCVWRKRSTCAVY